MIAVVFMGRLCKSALPLPFHGFLMHPLPSYAGKFGSTDVQLEYDDPQIGGRSLLRMILQSRYTCVFQGRWQGSSCLTD